MAEARRMAEVVLRRSPDVFEDTPQSRFYVAVSQTPNPSRRAVPPMAVMIGCADVLEHAIAKARALTVANLAGTAIDLYGFGRSLYWTTDRAEHSIAVAAAEALLDRVAAAIGKRCSIVKTVMDAAATGSAVYGHIDQVEGWNGQYAASVLLRDDGGLGWPIGAALAGGEVVFRQHVGDVVLMAPKELYHWRPPYEGVLAVRVIARYLVR